MFNLRDFIVKTISGMVGREADYKVRQYALGWYDKGVLTDADQTVEDGIAALQVPQEPEEIVLDPAETAEPGETIEA